MAFSREPKDVKGHDFISGATGRGMGYTRKVCLCGQKFSVPHDAFAKVTNPVFRGKNEMPDFWFANVRFPQKGYERRHVGEARGGQISEELKTPRMMLKFEAAVYFERELKGKSAIATMYRKVALSGDEFTQCRKCRKESKSSGAKRWLGEIASFTLRNGEVVNVNKPNAGKPLPERFNGAVLGVSSARAKVANVRKNEEKRIWHCTFPAIRGDRGYTLTADKLMTETEARQWFKDHSGRGNLAGCSVYSNVF